MYPRLRTHLSHYFFQYVPGFLGYWAVYQHGRFEPAALDAVSAKLSKEYWPTLVEVWKVWLPLGTFTFAAVPLRHQPAFFASMALVWNTYLSYMCNSD